jgi:hypothetical protein
VSEVSPHSELVQAIIEARWEASGVAEAYTALLLDLVSARSTLAQPVLRMLVRHFYPIRLSPAALALAQQHASTNANANTTNANANANATLNAYDEAGSRISWNTSIRMIREIVRLVPLASPLASATMSELHPHHALPLRDVRAFIKASLAADPAPHQALQRALATATAIDVELYATEDELQFDSDAAERVAALDALMRLLLKHTARSHSNVFPLLLDSFVVVVLPTHRSRFVQFVMMHACSLARNYAEQFVARLLALDASPALRRAALAYVGSFIAKAVYITPE